MPSGSHHVARDGFQGVVVAFVARHLEQVQESARALVFSRVHDAVQRLLLVADFLGAFRVIPDGRVFQLRVDLFSFSDFLSKSKIPPKFGLTTGQVVQQGGNGVDAFGFHDIGSLNVG